MYTYIPREDLVNTIKFYMQAGEIIVILMYENENLNKGGLWKELKQINTRDIVRERAGKKVPATHFRGKNQIYVIWA